MADTKSGVWFDKDSGKVVTSQPRRGRQLAAPGREPTNAEKAAIERYKEAAADGSAPPPETVTTSSTTAPKPSK